MSLSGDIGLLKSQNVQSLLQRVPSMRSRERRRLSMGQSSGATALNDAVAKGKLHLAKFILEAVEGRCLANSRDSHGKTPLIRAVQVEDNSVRYKMTQLLLKYGASVNSTDNVGRTALSYACEHFHNDVVKLFVKSNVDPDFEDKNGNTALSYCAMVGNVVATEILTKSFRRLGLNVDKKNADGMTPVMLAAKNNFVECAILLKTEGKASLEERDSIHYKTAYDWANGNSTHPLINSLIPKSKRTFTSPSNDKQQLDASFQTGPAIQQHRQRGACSIVDDNINLETEFSSETHDTPTEDNGCKNGRRTDNHYLMILRKDYHSSNSKKSNVPEFYTSDTIKDRNIRFYIKNTKLPVAYTKSLNRPSSATSGLLSKRTTQQNIKSRPFSACRSDGQSRSFDSAIGFESGSLEYMNEIDCGRKKRYIMADTSKLMSLTSLSRSSENLYWKSNLKKKLSFDSDISNEDCYESTTQITEQNMRNDHETDQQYLEQSNRLPSLI